MWVRAPITELEKGDGSKSYLASCFHQKSDTYFIKLLQSILIISVDTQYINPFLFIIGLSCPRSVQTSLTQNFLKLTIPGFPYNLLPVSCGDISFKKA
jgi:hypothetical protein